MTKVDLTPGDEVLLDGSPAEVLEQYSVGHHTYLRVYIEDSGLKTVRIGDVEIQPRQHPLDALDPDIVEQLHPGHEAVSAEWFDLRSQALQFQLTHEHRHLLSIPNSLVTLEPYQLAVVTRVMQKLRQRALIADDIGLGKTIEAGLILKELTARDRADRILLVVPAPLGKKWLRDMDRFFDLDFTWADSQWVENQRRRLGEEANIWDQEHQRLVASQVFLRRDEFQAALDDANWDAVVVDEAHNAAKRGPRPNRTALMVDTIASNSEALLLLSATPHTGKEETLRSLINYLDPLVLGEDQTLSKETIDSLMIRRGKHTLFDNTGERMFPDREIETVAVEMTPEERRFYRSVTEYVQTVYSRSEDLNTPAVGEAMTLLQKRLASSLGAVEASLTHRLRALDSERSTATDLSPEAAAYLEGEALEEGPRHQAEAELSTLTVTENDCQFDDEIEMLGELVSLAEEIDVDSKARQVRRFIRDFLDDHPDETLLVLTQYRDTLDHILALVDEEPWADEVLVVDGDVDREERARIEAEFTHGKSRLLFATDAASEGLDLQYGCHRLLNYELPWSPTRLEQRVGRLHCHGQEEDVSVWSVLHAGTRESELFRLFQNEIENIGDSLGNRADVLGLLEDIDMDSLIMESILSGEPVSATKGKLEARIEDRHQTLQEWHERGLIETSRFDLDSRAEIQALMDESSEVYGLEADIREFVERGVETLDGTVKKLDSNRYRATLPRSLLQGPAQGYGPFTFSREFAMNHDDIDYVSPDKALVQQLKEQILDSEHGTVGLKLFPFVDNPGIVYNYRVTFEDGTGDVIFENLIPVYVDTVRESPRHRIGQRVLQEDSVEGSPDSEQVRSLIRNREALRPIADRYISKRVSSLKQELLERRRTETQRELALVERYAKAERQRIEEFIKAYEHNTATGSNQDIAVHDQQKRIRELEQRIDPRVEELQRKSDVISLAPTVENLCLVLPE